MLTGYSRREKAQGYQKEIRGAYSFNSLLPHMYLRSSSYDPIVPERTWNGFITDLKRRYG